MSVPGDILLKAGTVINIIMPKMQTQSTNPTNDAMRTGDYLVSSVHHKFIQDISTTILELLSDSVNTDLNPSSQSSDIVSKLIKA